MSLQEQLLAKKLKQVTTTVTTIDGKKFVESKDGQQIATGERAAGFCIDNSPDFVIAEIIPGIFLGSQDGAHNLDQLRRNNITHILNIATGVACAFPESFQYLVLEVLDLPETTITSYFDQAFAFIDSCLAHHGAVLIHCNAGISRSASITIGYLMARRSMSFDDAYTLTKSKRKQIQPNVGFAKQLREYKP